MTKSFLYTIARWFVYLKVKPLKILLNCEPARKDFELMSDEVDTLAGLLELKGFPKKKLYI